MAIGWLGSSLIWKLNENTLEDGGGNGSKMVTLLIRFCQTHPKNCQKDDNHLLKSQNLRLKVLICVAFIC